VQRSNPDCLRIALGAGGIRWQRLRSGKQRKSKYDELEQFLHKLY